MEMKAKRFLSWMMSVLLALTLLPLTALAEGGEVPPQTGGLSPYIRYLECKGIMEGFPDGTFRPEAVLTRADAAKIMVLAKKLPLVSGGNPTFSDVPSGYWAYSCIETAVQAGLMNGYPGGTFGPEKPITRVEAATLLLNLSGGAFSDEILSVADVGAGNWAYSQTVTAVKAGIMSLSSDGFFFPGTAFTRGEMAQSLYALLTLSPALRKAELVDAEEPSNSLSNPGNVYSVTPDTVVIELYLFTQRLNIPEDSPERCVLLLEEGAVFDLAGNP